MNDSRIWLLIVEAIGIVIGVVMMLPAYFSLRAWAHRLREANDDLASRGENLLGQWSGYADSLRDTIGELEKEKRDLTTEVRMLTSRLGVAEERIAVLDRTLAETDRDLEAARQRIAAIESENGDLSQNLAEARAEIASLQARLAEATDRIRELGDEALSLKSQIADLQSKVSDLDEKLAQAHRHRAELDADNSRHAMTIDELTGKLDGAKRRVLELDAELQSRHAEIAGHVAAIAEVTGKHEDASRRVSSLEDEGRNLRGDIGERDRSIRDLSDKHDVASRRASDLDREVQTRLAEIAAHTASIANLTDKHSAANRLASELESEIARLKSSAEESIRETASLRERIATVETDRGALELKSRELQGTIDDLTPKLTAARADVAKMGEQVAKMGEQIETLERWIHEHVDNSGPRETPTWAEYVTIGLDFGTHSTKVVARNRNDQDAWVLRLDKSVTGYASFATPTLVRLVDGKLFFGANAAQMHGGQLFRDLKVALLAITEKEQAAATDHSSNGDEPDSEGEPVRAEPARAEVLAAIYLTWILCEVHAALNRDKSKYYVQIGVPMDRMKDRRLARRYTRIMSAAWSAALGPDPIPVSQGADLEELAPMFASLLGKRLIPVNKRRFDVFPETVAALASFYTDPAVRSGGIYLIADMGATTTELSVSNVALTTGDESDVECHHDRSVLLGGDDFTRLEGERDAEQFKAHTSEVVERFLREFRETWGEGWKFYAQEPPEKRAICKNLTVVLAGGGLLHPKLLEKVTVKKNSPQMQIFFAEIDDCHYSVDEHRPKALKFWTPPTMAVTFEPVEALSMLAVAHGLSIERLSWPSYRLPGKPKELIRPSAYPPPDEKYEQRYND
jgi:septal ring factor EnvC (AmiA/AmiB activator)